MTELSCHQMASSTAEIMSWPFRMFHSGNVPESGVGPSNAMVYQSSGSLVANTLYAACGLDENDKEVNDNSTLKEAEVKMERALLDVLDVKESIEVEGALHKVIAKKETMIKCLRKAEEAAQCICGVGDNEQLLTTALQSIM